MVVAVSLVICQPLIILLPGDYNVFYTYTDSTGKQVSKSVTVTVLAAPRIRTCPSSLDFGTHYRGEATTFLNPQLAANLTVESGIKLNSHYQFLVQAQSNSQLASSLLLKDQTNQWQDLATPTVLPVPLPTLTTSDNYQYTYDFSALIKSDKWKLMVPVTAQKPGPANQTVTWTISNSL